MASVNSEINKYNKLRAGHAQALGIDLENMTEVQEHELANRLEIHGVIKPNSLTLNAASDNSGINPSVGNDLAEAPKGRASNQKDKNPIAPKVSPASFNPEIMQIFEHLASQGDRVGSMGMEIFRTAMSRQVQAGMTNLVLDATVGIKALEGDADSFLDAQGY